MSTTLPNPATSVDSATVQGRRELHFASLDEVLADAEKLVASPTTRTLGNWPLGALLAHLAGAMNRSIDGIPFKAPWYKRLFALFLKGRLLRNGLRPGVKLPREREPLAFPATPAPEALEMLRRAVGRLKSERATAAHPFFGTLTHEEWVRFHLRHAELHLSFAVLA
jgi:hypothetical protein